MQEVTLTEQDYQTIKSSALNEWQSNTLTYKNADNYNCICYMKAFLAFCKSKGYTVVDGKIYVK